MDSKEAWTLCSEERSQSFAKTFGTQMLAHGPAFLLSFFLCTEVKLHSRVRLFVTQARILEWGSLSLLQGIFPIQGLNPGLLHCRRILYQLSHKNTRIGCYFLLQGNLASPGINPRSPALAGRFFTTSTTWEEAWLPTKCLYSSKGMQRRVRKSASQEPTV